jgi:transposase
LGQNVPADVRRGAERAARAAARGCDEGLHGRGRAGAERLFAELWGVQGSGKHYGLDMLKLLAAQLDALDVKLKLLETRVMALHRENPLSQCLASQPGIGPIGAVSFAFRVTDPKSFRSGRHFAAWLGLTPKDNSSGGRRRQGRISRQGNEALRKLVVLGATAVIRFAKPGHASPWLLNLLARKPKKLAAIALANKMARTLWAMMVSGELYRRPLPA